ncbi:MAG: hypothetical protein SH848_06460 [Saprospiraceae bacterium]|nr:hypothetical protein [Saprospiraceae bacterium]MDZ4703550.1 hypothetical protein [Saprospiraceae bacterium]
MADTPGGPIKKQQIAIIQVGVELLKEKQGYSQLAIVEKLELLNFKVSEAALSKIVRNNEGGNKILKIAAEGIQELIRREIGVEWEETKYSDTLGSDWKQTLIKETETTAHPLVNPGFTFYEDGRLPIAQKVDFISEAKQEVIEFGVVLNTFAGYFFSRNEKEFKQHVQGLLTKGVHFKCYLLDPDCEETNMYFSDRAKHLPDELKSIGKIREAIEKLGKVQQQFINAGYRGTFEIFAYQHIPANYFMTVDGDSPDGKLMVSHYVYGLSRANCPVLEFSKKNNPALYDRYWDSLKMLAQNARRL